MDVVGTQRARSLQHFANGLAASVGPVSHEILHAPVDVPSTGLKHGVQRSLAAHVSCGSSVAWDLTCGITTERQRPSLPLTEVHVGGVNLPPVRIATSGTQRFVPSIHLPSCAACIGSLTRAGGTQCAS